MTEEDRKLFARLAENNVKLLEQHQDLVVTVLIQETLLIPLLLQVYSAKPESGKQMADFIDVIRKQNIENISWLKDSRYEDALGKFIAILKKPLPFNWSGFVLELVTALTKGLSGINLP